MVKQHRFLNFNNADAEQRKMRQQGRKISVIARDNITGGYYFEEHVR